MATVGQQLLAPEQGWKRYDDNDKMITYVGTGWVRSNEFSYNGNLSHSNMDDASIQFNFTGNKLRIIDQIHPNRSKNINVIIDGQVYTYSAMGDNQPQSLVFEVKNLPLGEHYVRIFKQSEGYMALDALDIDSDGEIKPYLPSQKTLIRITMNDSSEREYKVTETEVDKFIQWINGAGRAGDNCYKFTDVVDESMEYLIFEKIISFKVLEL